MKYLLLALSGCAAQGKARHANERQLYAVPDCTRLKEECPIVNGRLSPQCKFVVACVKVMPPATAKK